MSAPDAIAAAVLIAIGFGLGYLTRALISRRRRRLNRRGQP
jgi:hypothetical protein